MAGCARHHSDAVEYRKCPSGAILPSTMRSTPRPSWLYLLVGVISYPILRSPAGCAGREPSACRKAGDTCSRPTTSRTSTRGFVGMPLFPHRYLRFMAKSELFWFPLGPFIAACGAFPVRRGQQDQEASRHGAPPLPRGEHRRHVPRRARAARKGSGSGARRGGARAPRASPWRRAFPSFRQASTVQGDCSASAVSAWPSETRSPSTICGDLPRTRPPTSRPSA